MIKIADLNFFLVNIDIEGPTEVWALRISRLAASQSG